MKGILISAGVFLFLLSALPVSALDFRGEFSTEGRFFFESPAYPGQYNHDGSLALDLEVYQELSVRLSFKVEPFYRVDSADSKRTHGDLRSCNFLYVADEWQLLLGVDKVFWGVAEFVHLVDIINQTDVVESLEGEEKLGQPMVHLSIERDWGTLDGFLLPYFRKRTFPGVEGRLRGPGVIHGTHATFESEENEQHMDVAVRYSQSHGAWDLGWYNFYGTSREPLFREEEKSEGEIIPHYAQIFQTGLDLQAISGQWLWKLEGVYRSSEEQRGGATVFGFEYSHVKVFGTEADVGLITECVFDERGIADYSLYDNDIMFGVRISLNNPESTELLLGVVQDLSKNSTVLSFEGSHRLSDFLKLELSGVLLAELDKSDPAFIYSDDSFLKLTMSWYF